MSESSLKRWSDEGQIRVSRTAGGHRRITIAEAIRFIRTTQSPLVKPEVLGLSDLTAGSLAAWTNEDTTKSLYEHFVSGRARDARGLLLSLYLGGMSVHEIADGPLRESMKRIGALWHEDPAGVFLEHRATEICMHVLGQLRMMVEPEQGHFTAVGGAAPGDSHAIPTLMAATALAEAGIDAINLGANTPYSALNEAIKRHRPRLVWISLSWCEGLNEAIEGLVEFRRGLPVNETTFVLGGNALPAIRLPPDANILIGGAMRELVRIADQIRTATT